MSALASLLPSFLKRRKRSAEEDEAHELRAVLNAASKAAVVEACLELRAANKALTQRLGELERVIAAHDEAAAQAMRDVVRDAVTRAAMQPWTFCAAGESVLTSDSDDPSDFDAGDMSEEVSLDASEEAHEADHEGKVVPDGAVAPQTEPVSLRTRRARRALRPFT